jgi:hypothetical protein
MPFTGSQQQIVSDCFEQARVDSNLSIPEFANLLGMSTEQIIAFETAVQSPTPEEALVLLHQFPGSVGIEDEVLSIAISDAVARDKSTDGTVKTLADQLSGSIAQIVQQKQNPSATDIKRVQHYVDHTAFYDFTEIVRDTIDQALTHPGISAILRGAQEGITFTSGPAASAYSYLQRLREAVRTHPQFDAQNPTLLAIIDEFGRLIRDFDTTGDEIEPEELHSLLADAQKAAPWVVTDLIDWMKLPAVAKIIGYGLINHVISRIMGSATD